MCMYINAEIFQRTRLMHQFNSVLMQLATYIGDVAMFIIQADIVCVLHA